MVAGYLKCTPGRAGDEFLGTCIADKRMSTQILCVCAYVCVQRLALEADIYIIIPLTDDDDVRIHE